MNDKRNYFVYEVQPRVIFVFFLASKVNHAIFPFCKGRICLHFQNGFFSFFCDKMFWHKQPKGEMVYFSSQFREQTVILERWWQQVAPHLWSWNIETKVCHLPPPIFSRVQTMKWSHSTLWWVFTHRLI